MTVIFNNLNQVDQVIHHVRGCERVIIARMDGVGPFQIDVELASSSDPRCRFRNIQTIGGDQEICINSGGFPCIACGMVLKFDATQVPVGSNVFIEILDDTCVPEPCCVTGDKLPKACNDC